jgi:pteridine reductase
MILKPTAIVTGGAKRVGRAIVIRLAREGFNVHFTYSTSKLAAMTLVEDVQRDGGGVAVCHQVDLKKACEVQQLIASIRTVGQLHLLVNNASLYVPDTSADCVDLMRINYDAPLQLTHGVASLLTRSNGHVINMLDILATKPRPTYMHYCASKAALQSATLSLARRLGPHVTVNGIAPGVVDWPDDMPGEQRDAYLKKVPLNRPGTPDDVAALVHFLITQGTYITGQIIALDGGRSLM